MCKAASLHIDRIENVLSFVIVSWCDIPVVASMQRALAKRERSLHGQKALNGEKVINGVKPLDGNKSNSKTYISNKSPANNKYAANGKSSAQKENQHSDDSDSEPDERFKTIRPIRLQRSNTVRYVGGVQFNFYTLISLSLSVIASRGVFQ